jgi:hypothetical protein
MSRPVFAESDGVLTYRQAVAWDAQQRNVRR